MPVFIATVARCTPFLLKEGIYSLSLPGMTALSQNPVSITWSFVRNWVTKALFLTKRWYRIEGPLINCMVSFF
jgi:hypothetical protein